VLLLNADTIVQEHAIESLVQFMDSCPKAGIAGSQLLTRDGEFQGSPFRFYSFLTEFDRGLRLGIVAKLLSACIAPPKTVCSADWVAGTSMILRRSMLDQIGLLDEGLYSYFDDVDICLRARDAGWETWYVPQSKIIHFGGAATEIGRVQKRLPSYWFEARRRYFLKNCGKLHTALADVAFLCGFACWRLRRRIQRKPDVDPPRMLADSFRHSVFCSGFQLRNVKNPLLQELEPVGVSE
jgi:GT2 family glycosyltransferase